MRRLLIALAVAALAALAIIPAAIMLRAPMPSLDNVVTTTTTQPHYTPWCVDHVSVQPSHPGTIYASGPDWHWGYDGTMSNGRPVVVDEVQASSANAALAHVLADCTNSAADS